MRTSKFFKTGLLLFVASLGLISCGDDDKEPEIVVDPVSENVEYYIEGKVVADNAALDGVSVTAGEATATTDENGQYSLTVKDKKTYTVSFAKEGYRTVSDASVEIANNATNRSLVTLNVTMSKEGVAVAVDPESDKVITEKGEGETEDAQTVLTIPAGAVSTATDVTLTPYLEAVATDVTPGSKEEAIPMTNIAISSSQDAALNQDVTLSVANASAGTKWGNVMRNYVGRPMGDMYMLKVIGTFNTEKDLAQYAKNGTQDIGDLIFEDYNKDGTIDVNDYQLVGNYQPDFTFGWNNTFIYKDFDLAVTIDGQCGGNVIYAAARAFSLNRYDDNVLAESGLGRWKSSTDPGNGRSHKAGTNNLGSNIGPSTRYLYDADFLRIRNVSLGYTLPKKFCKIIGIENMRISANVQNLWTFDKYPGYSVEANYEGNSATNNGVDFGGYPISRTFTFGLNFNF